jgi:uncharacterized coiled-coil protein SlyX
MVLSIKRIMASFDNETFFEYSFYIPRIYSYWTENGIKNYFELNQLGYVARVDFIPINTVNDPTDLNYYFINTNTTFVSAFVHILSPREDDLVTKNKLLVIKKTIETEGQVEITPLIGETWYLRKCHNPLADNIYNVTQLSELHRQLEIKVANQQKQIDESNKLIQKLIKLMDLNSEEMKLKLFQEDENNSIESTSTHSSMPSLVSTASSKERMVISNSLCGNE